MAHSLLCLALITPAKENALLADSAVFRSVETEFFLSMSIILKDSTVLFFQVCSEVEV